MIIFKSIRWRLQLWLAFLLLCVLSGFGVTVYQLQRLNQLHQIDQQLESRVAALSGAVRGIPRGTRPFDPGRGSPPGRDDEEGSRPPPPRRDEPDSPPPDGPRKMRPGSREVRLSSETLSLFDQSSTNDFYFAIWSRSGTLLNHSTNAPAALPQPERVAGDTRTHIRLRGSLRESFHFTEMNDCVLAGRSLTPHLAAMRRFTGILLAVGGGVLALGLGGGSWLAGRAIRPVKDISAAASRISAGNLSERISVANTDNELGRLAGVLNSTFARLEAAFAQQKQFTADASHELRTPIAVIISEAQTTLARERNPAEYRETIQACLDTAQQMRRLSDSLLELARFDAGQEQAPPVSLDLAEKAGACVERIRPLAAQSGLQIQCDLAPAKTLANADRLDQVITNLLTNAIQYNKPKGEIRLRTFAENGAAILAIADTGIGIAPEDLPHIYERFYRADKSRSRAQGRNGLGLAICKAIVDSTGGTIEVTSQLGVGTTFTVRLPADQSP